MEEDIHIAGSGMYKTIIILLGQLSYRHEIKTIVHPRSLNKTYPRIKQGLPGIDTLVLRAVGWWAGFQKRSIECQLYFWILKSYQHGTRIGRERDSRPKHVTGWIWNVACMRLHSFGVCLHLLVYVCVCVCLCLHASASACVCLNTEN